MTSLVPARVLVKGASSAVAVAPVDGPRSDISWVRLLEHHLPAHGLPVTLQNTAREGQLLRQAACSWNTSEYVWSPDVVILNHCMYECVNGLLPWWWERHANGRHHHPGPVRDRYMRKVLRPTWRTSARLQRLVETRVDPLRFASTDRTMRELSSLVRQTRVVARPLVLVMDLWTPGEPWTTWFTGFEARAKQMTEALHGMVASFDDPEVRVFPLGAIVDAEPPAVAVPDGVHFAAHVHRQVATRLAAEILEWAAGQPHLQHPGLRPLQGG